MPPSIRRSLIHALVETYPIPLVFDEISAWYQQSDKDLLNKEVDLSDLGILQE